MKKLYLPSLRGTVGDWIYYPTLMKFKDIAERVDLAKEIYQSNSLNDMVQREIKEQRGQEIRDYLLQQNQRFFNSLIVAVYEGDPNWYEISSIENNTNLDDIDLPTDIPDEVINSIGILSLNGKERLFTVDGQHRLIGIKEAVASDSELRDDELSVIFIAHKTDHNGMERSRRLFTTLNKKGIPVSKGEIIALDEDDTMAITARRLVVENQIFMDKRILNHPTDNIPINNQTCLTTIGHLYDLLVLLFTKVYVSNRKSTLKKRREKLTIVRQSDNILNEHYKNACKYFELLTDCFIQLKEFAEKQDYSEVVQKYRHAEGGNILFRPIGLTIITEIVAKLAEKYPLSKCFKMISHLPTEITGPPYNHVIWDAGQKKIKSNKTLARDLLLFMLDQSIDEKKLRQKYAKVLDVDINKVNLPDKVL